MLPATLAQYRLCIGHRQRPVHIMNTDLVVVEHFVEVVVERPSRRAQRYLLIDEIAAGRVEVSPQVRLDLTGGQAIDDVADLNAGQGEPLVMPDESVGSRDVVERGLHQGG